MRVLKDEKSSDFVSQELVPIDKQPWYWFILHAVTKDIEELVSEYHSLPLQVPESAALLQQFKHTRILKQFETGKVAEFVSESQV